MFLDSRSSRRSRKSSHGVIPELPDLSGYPISPNELRSELETMAALKTSPAHIRDIASVVVQMKAIFAQYIPVDETVVYHTHE